MKKLMLFGAVFCLAENLFAQSGAINVPDKVKPFITPGYEVMDIKTKDLNGDNLKDYLLVLRIKNEDTLTLDNPNWNTPRPLLLIAGQPAGKLKLVAVNKEAVYCKNCGGSMGDPYEGISLTKPNEFTISHYGGSSWRWMDELTFKYDKIKKNWFLQQQVSTSFQAGDPDATTRRSVIQRSEIGDISLADFKPDYNADSSFWFVTVPQTFFYNSPDLKSKPRKGYLVKENMVKGIKAFKNFIEVSYENEKGVLTYGYILRKHLMVMAPPPEAKTID